MSPVEIEKSCGAQQKNLKEDRPISLAGKSRQMILLGRNIKWIWIQTTAGCMGNINSLWSQSKFIGGRQFEGPGGLGISPVWDPPQKFSKFYVQICTFWCFLAIFEEGWKDTAPQQFRCIASLAPFPPPPGSMPLPLSTMMLIKVELF